jgi:membrane protease YdiL (CAAX protease family)
MTVPAVSPAEPEAPPTIWTGGKVAILAGVWLLGGLPVSIIAFAIQLAQGTDPADVELTPLLLFLTLLTQMVGTLVAAAIIARSAGRSLTSSLGLRITGSDLAGLIYGVLLQIAVALVVTAPLITLFDAENAEQAVGEIGEGAETGLDMALFVLAVVVVGPLVEEVLFRGALLRWLRAKVSSTWAIVISAAAFGSVHIMDPGAAFAVPGLFVIGLVLAWTVVKRQGRIGMAIAIHAGVNLVGALVFIFADELTELEQQLRETVDAVLTLF